MVKLPGSGKSDKSKKNFSKGSGKPAGKAFGKSAEKQAAPGVIAEWLYLADHEVSVVDLAASFTDKKECEIWMDAEIAEVILTEKASMDMERAEAVMEDEIGDAFLKEHGVTELYLVTIVPEEYELAKKAMGRIIAHCGGFFCADNDDFTPQVRE